MQLIQKQQGVVLITGLIFLVALTLIGTASLRGILLEEKMAGNLRDETLAFQAAEAALRSGEAFLEQVTLPSFDGTNGLYHHAESPAPDLADWSGWETTGKLSGTTVDGVVNQPRYVIEQLPSISPDDSGSVQQTGSSFGQSMFRVVAHGVGGTDTVAVVLQSVYRR